VHNSARWRYKVQPAYLRQHPLCAMCEAEAPPRLRPAVHVDHIVPLRDGGAPFDWSNLRSLCHSHHSAVTRQWQNQRTGSDPEPPAPSYTIA
jgi:5-methylcytosine-specific restriction protein A